jgi:hypothetical protein
LARIPAFSSYSLTQGADNIESALAAEKKNLQANYGISPTLLWRDN